MKKILYLLMLTALFVSCSSDDDNTDPNNGNGNKGMIDEKILGKWKVEYSKTIKPAQFDEKTGKVSFEENALIREYLGNWGEPNVEPESGMFDPKEIRIEIKNDNTIVVSIGGGNPKTVSYKIENGYLKQTFKDRSETLKHKYYFEDSKLVMELLPNQLNYNIYTISKYSKIAE